MSAGHVILFANPIAGRGQGRGAAQRITRRLQQSGMRVTTIFDAPESVRDDQIPVKGADEPTAVVTIGGDGTLRAAAQRLLDGYGGDAAGVPPILVVPLGTANLMVRHLGIAWNEATLEDHVVSAILARRTMHLDAARANGKLFLLMAGVGIDASVVHELDRVRRGPIDMTSYATPLLLALSRYAFPSLAVEVDKRRVFGPQPAMAFVGNIPEYGTGFPILSRARPDDALLDVCILPCGSRAQIIRLAMLAATGDHLSEEGVVYTKGRCVRIESPQQVPVQIDGEASGHTPLEIELLPSRMRFIVP
jgi:YegS/Rv2252/BmrU family lipid kinase